MAGPILILVLMKIRDGKEKFLPGCWKKLWCLMSLWVLMRPVWVLHSTQKDLSLKNGRAAHLWVSMVPGTGRSSMDIKLLLFLSETENPAVLRKIFSPALL